ncbi:MAG: sensor histidine kinase [Bdellovibrionales bacterium]
MGEKKVKELDESINFEEVSNLSMMGIIVFAADTRQAVFLNPIAKETLEIPPELKMDSISLQSLYPVEARSKSRIFSEDFLQDGGFYQDIMLKRFNGINIIANLGVRFLSANNKIMIMFQDVTFQKKLQREVQVKQQELMRSYSEILAQNEELKNLSAAKDKLITLSSHELRTPLSAIIAMTETLSLGIVEDKSEIMTYYKDIHRESQSLMFILNNMLDLLKLKTGKMPFFISQKNVSSCFIDAIEDLHLVAEEKQVELKIKLPEELTAYIDKTRMKKPFQYIVGNAIQFTKENSSVVISAREDEEKVYIHVRDHGPGIPDDFSESIFEEFTTLGDIETHSKGAGLSLSIAKLTMVAHGGDLVLNPLAESGAEFIFEIPKEKVLDEEIYSDEDPFEDIEF